MNRGLHDINIHLKLIASVSLGGIKVRRVDSILDSFGYIWHHIGTELHDFNDWLS